MTVRTDGSSQQNEWSPRTDLRGTRHTFHLLAPPPVSAAPNVGYARHIVRVIGTAVSNGPRGCGQAISFSGFG
jgi:hypothetical protein